MTMLRKHKRKIIKGGEAGFTIVELIIVMVLTSFLGTFGFQLLAQSLVAQRNMQVRKAHSDDAVLTLGKISRELSQGERPIHKFGGDELGFVKVVGSGNLYVLYTQVGQEVLRYETASTGSTSAAKDTDYLSALAAGGAVVAKDVNVFVFDVDGDRGDVSLTFNQENDARTTKVLIRNEI